MGFRPSTWIRQTARYMLFIYLLKLTCRQTWPTSMQQGKDNISKIGVHNLSDGDTLVCIRHKCHIYSVWLFDRARQSNFNLSKSARY